MRERGGSFTLIALALATLILMSAGLLTDASRNILVLSAQEGRRSALREGAFAGVAWASAARAAGVQRPGGLVELMSCKVTMSTLASSPAELQVEARAVNGVGEKLRILATLRPAKGAWELVSYELAKPK